MKKTFFELQRIPSAYHIIFIIYCGILVPFFVIFICLSLYLTNCNFFGKHIRFIIYCFFFYSFYVDVFLSRVNIKLSASYLIFFFLQLIKCIQTHLQRSEKNEIVSHMASQLDRIDVEKYNIESVYFCLCWLVLIKL